MKNKAKNHCAWCRRPLGRVGICASCAAIITANVQKPKTRQPPRPKYEISP